MTLLFVGAVLLGTALQLWLSVRQVTEVARHRARVPAPFAAQVSLAEHQKAADYTAAKVRFHRIETMFGALVTLALTVGGGIAAVDLLWQRTGWPQPWIGAAIILTVISASHSPQAHSHQSVPARSMRLSTTTITGPPSSNINTALLS